MSDMYGGTHRALRVTVCTIAGVIAVAAALTMGVRPVPAGAQEAKKEDPKPAGDMVKLPIKLPKQIFAGTALELPPGADIEKLSKTPRLVPLVPKGTVNLALKKKVTSSAPPFTGSLDLLVDGDIEGKEDSTLELKPRLQWVQIDLGATSPLSYIVVWHFHQEPCVFHSVIVQVSNDPKFVDGVTTLFNNDQENSAGLGIGKDREYIESYEGKLIDAKGAKARYVRLYSNGSIYRDKLNRYNEVEVYGQPAK